MGTNKVLIFLCFCVLFLEKKTSVIFKNHKVLRLFDFSVILKGIIVIETTFYYI